ncbi:MAG: cell surface protein [Lachnospiraceae bacterium]|nr:cell surface protein [Lachnospiraceae bacterium]
MYHIRRYIVMGLIVISLCYIKFNIATTSYLDVHPFRGGSLKSETFNPLIAASVNENILTVSIDGNDYNNSIYDIFMDDNLNIMVPVNILTDSLNCSVHLYPDNTLLLEKRDEEVALSLGQNTITVNGETENVEDAMIQKNNSLYVSLEDVTSNLQYNYQWDIETNGATAYDNSGETSILPAKYDLREKGRTSTVKNQGSTGTCWAFASLAALESDLLPMEAYEYSPDHMSRRNSFTKISGDSGEYTMAMAYLLAWQGPVYEAEDPFGDGVSPEGLSPEKHIQEIQLINGKDYEKIKEAVFKYGGVETSLYSTIRSNYDSGAYYNDETYGYCYIGTEKPNHEVVIVGWDDNYSKDNFTTSVEGDGAFICQNSWGDSFGENGYFYVSYYDTNIGSHNVIYTGVEATDNYDRIYQSDLCGWVGQVGYNRSDIYAANVYTALENEYVKACGFYATGQNTTYSVYFVNNFTDTSSLNTEVKVAEGTLKNAGYYTIDFDEPKAVTGGEKYAVVIVIDTPEATNPMAVEYAGDEATADAIIDDGEGYISSNGSYWESTEQTNGCNLCLKAYSSREVQ